MFWIFTLASTASSNFKPVYYRFSSNRELTQPLMVLIKKTSDSRYILETNQKIVQSLKWSSYPENALDEDVNRITMEIL